ncbi:Glycosyl hydrolase family 71 [Bradyrhizobium sp. Gha]|nr:Glycosyl hydrolase family 71 [Bradyrhizobium sp. Gha]
MANRALLGLLGRHMVSTLFALATLVGTLQAHEPPSVPRMVFAHYMVCCPVHGLAATIEDFAQEIAIARSYGIDGFALNVPGWKQEPHYLEISRRIFRAAERSGSSFKLFMSFDGAPVEDSATMLAELSQSPAYLRIDDRPVVSTYSGSPEWGERLVRRLAAMGLKPFLVPNYQYPSEHFWVHNHGHPTAEFLDAMYRDHPEVDGYFVFGPDLGYPKPPADGALVANRSKIAGKISMIGIMPYYRGLRGNFRVFESGGLQGMAAQWASAIEAGADWIEIVTWNDWGEATYVAPYGGSRQQDLWNYGWGPLLSHEMFLKASRYYIDWFKSSRPPAIEHPSIYYFYRPHSKSAYGIASPDTGEQGRPKGSEDLVDGIYLSAFLPRPLTVDLIGGERHQSVSLPAGVCHHRFDLMEGALTIKVSDQGRQIAEKQLEFPVTKLGQIGNFNYFAGEVPLP